MIVAFLDTPRSARNSRAKNDIELSATPTSVVQLVSTRRSMSANASLLKPAVDGTTSAALAQQAKL